MLQSYQRQCFASLSCAYVLLKFRLKLVGVSVLQETKALMGDKIERLAFGEFVLDRANALLWRGGERVPLRPKPFAVLCCLVERAGELVTKEELLDAVWSNLH